MSFLFTNGLDMYLIWILVPICIFIYNGLKLHGVYPYNPIEVVSYAIYAIVIAIIYSYFRLFPVV